ncbi:hypothetical protein B808_221 [Fructilactobacillus florum 8D]|uniref:Uncharacterized protein n=1 Tax=Fructilactobacillus florum 8D TaxID=1221538 RepID=W9EI72_9LACO|nr:hypothetical protein [Fructilactobacillus florum]EKK20257.1 hypothetical protein B807_1067 [Fructilactobacillus florum 2F]ETO40941.1 hypothetical protein B808_221 [Fructilactobacillus florum 8D]
MDINRVEKEIFKRAIKTALPAAVRVKYQIIKSEKQIKINEASAERSASIKDMESALQLKLQGKAGRAAEKACAKLQKGHFTKGADSL